MQRPQHIKFQEVRGLEARADTQGGAWEGEYWADRSSRTEQTGPESATVSKSAVETDAVYRKSLREVCGG